MEEQIRVLQFPGTMLYGGVGSVVMNLYRNIDRTKIQFDFCVPRSERGPLDNEIESLGGRIFHVPQMREKGFLNYVNCIRQIIKENGPYSAVHIHSIHMGAVTLYAAKSVGVRTIYHAHNTQDPALDHIPCHHLIEWGLRKYIQRNASIKLACGVLAGKYIYDKKQFYVINNAVDLSRFYPYNNEKRNSIRKELGIQEEDIVVGDVARFTSVKNMTMFINLAIADRNNVNKLKFLLVGDGETKKTIEYQICNNSLQDHFILTGNRKDVDILYNAMDVFCLPSLFEGLPVSLMEAQAVGLPCVISNAVTKEGIIGSTKVTSLSLEDDIELWLKSIYDLSKERIDDVCFINEEFSKKKYQIVSIAKEMESIYLSKHESI